MACSRPDYVESRRPIRHSGNAAIPDSCWYSNSFPPRLNRVFHTKQTVEYLPGHRTVDSHICDVYSPVTAGIGLRIADLIYSMSIESTFIVKISGKCDSSNAPELADSSCPRRNRSRLPRFLQQTSLGAVVGGALGPNPQSGADEESGLNHPVGP